MEETLTKSLPMVFETQDQDASLVERYLAGDVTAFDEIMIRYERQIYRVCYRFVENRDDRVGRRILEAGQRSDLPKARELRQHEVHLGERGTILAHAA